MSLTPFIAAGDSNWIGLVLLLIFAIVSAVSKAMEKKRESQLPEEPAYPQAPRPRPPPPMRVPTPPVTRLPERSALEERMRQILEQAERRAQRQRRPAQPPPVIEEPVEKPRRLVDRLAQIERQKAELPSGRPGEVPHQIVLPSVHPEEVPHERVLPSALKQPLSVQMSPTVVGWARGARFREQLHSRASIRQAIVLREVLGPPLVLRED
ncbi:MAG: hypothetical protein HZA91_08340 [Verrucomicrobia bacterium]|nr:hypothetical protein [Verrucomicrobiota bacterium]